MIHTVPDHVHRPDKVRLHLHEYNRNEETFTYEEMKKWLLMARAAQSVESPCLSRQIGIVIADPRTGALVSSGHNGPPDGCPGNDDGDYLQHVIWPQLNHWERLKVLGDMNEELKRKPPPDHYEPKYGEAFAATFGGCGTCPRKLVGAPSGQRLELCTCAHGETNAIIRAHRSVAGCWMFCSCGVPCIDCTKLILNSRLRVVIAVDHGGADYSPYSSRWMFAKGHTDLILVTPDWLDDQP